MPERAEVLPIGIAFDHPGDDGGRCGLLGGDPGEISQILLGFANDLRIVGVVDFFVAGDDEGGFERGNFVQVGDPLCPFGFTASAVIMCPCQADARVTTAAWDGTERMVDSAVSA